MREIYKDEKRTITWSPGQVRIESPGKNLPTIPVAHLICDQKIHRKTLAALKAAKLDSKNYRTIFRIGEADLVIPSEIAEVVYREARRLEREHRAECERVSNLPENVARRAVDGLLAMADRLERSGSDDNVSGPIRLRADARRKLAEWRERYPEAARAEDARDLRSRADALRSLAAGALVYDADGSLSAEYQQARHDELIKDAEALEAQANELEENDE